MKRILLYAMVTLLAGTASAQGVRKSPATMRQQQRHIPAALKAEKVTPVLREATEDGQLFLASNPYEKRVMKVSKGAAALKAGKSTFKRAARRAGVVQQEYTGYGTTSSGSVQWTMKSSTADDKLYLTDIIPDLSDFNEELKDLTVEYTLSGNTLTIQPQYIGQNVYEGVLEYIYVFALTDDGIITFTLGDDNSLTVDQSLSIFYGAFSENRFVEPANEAEFDALYTGTYERVQNIQFLLPGQIKAPGVMYEPEGVYLHVGYSPSWYAYSKYAIMYLPADATVHFNNYTSDPTDTWEWNVQRVEWNDGKEDYDVVEVTTSDKRDFEYVTVPNAEYYPISLVGTFQGAASTPYQWAISQTEATDGIIMAGGSSSTWRNAFTDKSTPMITKACPTRSLSLYASLGTPDLNSNEFSISSLIFYQGKPAAPLYFTGINLWTYNFKQQDDFNLTCKIQKCTRDAAGRLSLGEVVAQADVDLDEIITDEATQLNWNSFYVEDEDGLTEDIDYIQMEDEFAIVFEGWNNGTFSAVPLGERITNTNGLTCNYFTMQSDDEEEEEEGESLYGYTRQFGHIHVGFKGFAYGYLYTEDDKNILLPAEGGEATIHVEPNFCSSDDDDEPTTALWLADDSEEQPEWLEVNVLNEDYAEDAEVWSFDLQFVAQALPEGVAGREAHLKFEQWGANLLINVVQGEGTGIKATATVVKNSDGITYNLAGQRVNKNFKGVVVRNGQKFIQR